MTLHKMPAGKAGLAVAGLAVLTGVAAVLCIVSFSLSGRGTVHTRGYVHFAIRLCVHQPWHGTDGVGELFFVMRHLRLRDQTLLLFAAPALPRGSLTLW